MPAREIDPERHAEAMRLWQLGAKRQMRHDVEGAIDLYRQSLAICPTAEAHTFLGWALSWQGDVEAAIAECKTAIEVDPDFGNPYNDIGAYLIELGRLDEAITWLERAKRALRYDPRHFPYLNLGRIYQKQGKITQAIRELQAAIEIAPDDPVASRALDKLRQLN